MTLVRPLIRRLLEKIKVDASTGCWNWTGSVKDDGYGQITVKRRTLRAHRASYEAHHGPIPDGLMVCHHCDNPICVNPEHLFLGTYNDNSDDKVAKGRQARGEGAGGAKLTEECVIAIRAANGIAQRKLAAKYDISQSQISNIRTGKTWAHIEEKQS